MKFLDACLVFILRCCRSCFFFLFCFLTLGAAVVCFESSVFSLFDCDVDVANGSRTNLAIEMESEAFGKVPQTI